MYVYVLDLQPFVVNKFPEDGTLVPKHVGAGNQYTVCFKICFIVL
jgi:hypothetical protein